jgi:hypothetical protein
VEVLGDAAYGSGEMLAALHDAGFDAVVKPIPLRPAVEDGFTLDDFDYDRDAGTLTCPNQITRTLSPKGTATFGRVCAGCPLRQRCTTANDGRSITLGEHEHLRRAHRKRAHDPAVAEVYRSKRPLVERSIAWLTRGNRRVPFRGVIKNNAWLHHRVAGLNLRRLLVLGLRYDHGTWQLA